MRSILGRAISSRPTSAPPHARDGQRLTLDGLPVLLRVNRRALRVSIRIDAVAGEAVVTAPSERRMTEAVAFARSRHAWIAEHLARRPRGAPLAPGAVLTVAGRSVRLEATGNAASARFVERDGETLILSGGEGEAFARRVERLLRAEARAALTARTEVHVGALGIRPATVAIGDPRSRWGSCSPRTRSIRYSWRVVMAPPEVLDYLAAHEVAHLVHADHSPAFWNVVERLIGDARPHRRWLREHGAGLHAVGR